MGWFILSHVFSTLISIIRIFRLSEQDKALEILLLRQQLDILLRKQNQPVIPNRAEKMSLAILTAKLKEVTGRPTRQLRSILRLFQPETVLGWYRFLVRRKWKHAPKNRGGRPRTDQALEDLILRLAHENPRCGYGKIDGELQKLGFEASQTTIRNILKRHNIEPAPVRNGSVGWRNPFSHYKEQLLACDFFTVETVALHTLFVLFFIELGSRRVFLAGVTANPNQTWVTQQARQLLWNLDDSQSPLHFLIRDNDAKFSDAFDAVFRSEGIHVIPIPFRTPNAFAERWVRTAREECLDHLLILNETHLRRVLSEFTNRYYNVARPHQGIDQRSPIPYGQPQCTGFIQRRNVVGGIIHDYYRYPAASPLPNSS
jgi:putative transposase